jgi:hypothetical protein
LPVAFRQLQDGYPSWTVGISWNGAGRRPGRRAGPGLDHHKAGLNTAGTHPSRAAATTFDKKVNWLALGGRGACMHSVVKNLTASNSELVTTLACVKRELAVPDEANDGLPKDKIAEASCDIALASGSLPHESVRETFWHDEPVEPKATNAPGGSADRS